MKRRILSIGIAALMSIGSLNAVYADDTEQNSVIEAEAASLDENTNNKDLKSENELSDDANSENKTEYTTEAEALSKETQINIEPEEMTEDLEEISEIEADNSRDDAAADEIAELTTQDNITELEDATELTSELTLSENIELYANHLYSYALTGGYIKFNTQIGLLYTCDTSVTQGVIPDKINGVAVERIAADCFKNCSRLRRLELPDDISIPNGAFSSCSNLTLVVNRGSNGERYAKKYSMTYEYKDGSVTSIPNDLNGWIFDASLYAASNPDIVRSIGSDSVKLYNHWINSGIAEGRTGSYVFEPKYYLDNNLDLRNKYGYNYKAAYEHFVNSGCNELRPSSPSYNPTAYKKRYPKLNGYSGANLLYYYVNTGRRNNENAAPDAASDTITIPNNIEGWIFDANVYKANNPDVVAAVGTDNNALYTHWKKSGISEGRIASYVFDAKYYLDNNLDLRNKYGYDYLSAYNHFINSGCNELRPSSAEYNGAAYKARYSDLSGKTGAGLVEHYVHSGRAEGRNAKAEAQPSVPTYNSIPDNIEGWIFDAAYYAKSNPDIASALGTDSVKLYNHWKNYGIAEGRTGSYIWDYSYYKANNRDLSGTPAELYQHFIKSGCNELRPSSAEYNAAAYKARYSDLSGKTGEQLAEHYVHNGKAEGRNAKAEVKPTYDHIPDNIEGWLFDAGYYLRQNPDVGSVVGTDALSLYNHWKNYGIAEGRTGSYIWEYNYYKEHNQDLNGSPAELYQHFIEYGCNELRPSSIIYSGKAYHDRYADLKNLSGDGLISHYVAYGRKEDRNAIPYPDQKPLDFTDTLFDPIYYANRYDDIRAAFGYDTVALYNHWANSGVLEGRSCNPLYDAAYYAKANSDLVFEYGADGYTSLYTHFFRYGMNEGRAASSEFNLSIYKENNPDLVAAFGSDNASYYTHYLRYGRYEGRKAF